MNVFLDGARIQRNLPVDEFSAYRFVQAGLHDIEAADVYGIGYPVPETYDFAPGQRYTVVIMDNLGPDIVCAGSLEICLLRYEAPATPAAGFARIRLVGFDTELVNRAGSVIIRNAGVGEGTAVLPAGGTYHLCTRALNVGGFAYCFTGRALASRARYTVWAFDASDPLWMQD